MAAFGRLFTENCDYVNIAGVHWNGAQEIVQRHAELFQNRLKTAVQALTGAEVRFPTPDTWCPTWAITEEKQKGQRKNWNGRESRIWNRNVRRYRANHF